MTTNLRKLLTRYLPSWLADNYPNGPSFGHRILWALTLLAEGQLEIVLQGSLAAVGRGTPSALPYLEFARGIARGRFDTDTSYAVKMSTWIQRWKEAGAQIRLAKEIAEYLGDSRVRIVNRAGHWVTVEANGTVTTEDAAWDWDGTSHPERAGWWAEIWIIVYPTWGHTGPYGGVRDWGGDAYGIGHLRTRRDRDAIMGIAKRFKSAHTHVRAIIWTSDASLFDPAVPSSSPDGTWGAWGKGGAGSRIPSRNLTTCRYWEPNT